VIIIPTVRKPYLAVAAGHHPLISFLCSSVLTLDESNISRAGR